MGGGVFIWSVVVVVLIIIYVIYVSRFCRRFESITENNASSSNRRILRTITIQAPPQPYTISNRNLQSEIEPPTFQSVSNFQLSQYQPQGDIKDNKDPPSYDEVIHQGLQKGLTPPAYSQCVRS